MSELTDRDVASDLYRDARLMDECGYLHIGTVMRRAAKRLEDHHNVGPQYEALMAAAKAIPRIRRMNMGGDDAAALIDVTCGDVEIALIAAGIDLEEKT